MIKLSLSGLSQHSATDSAHEGKYQRPKQRCAIRNAANSIRKEQT
jgi:hypothetical protein